MKVSRSAVGVALVCAGALTVSSCGSDTASGQSGSGAGDAGTISVVASTNVWGDIAQQVGGDAVDVTSIISDPDQDPHSYEASTQTALAISEADLVIENGGGYDDFVGRMLDSTGSGAEVLDAVDISGRTAADGGELNEHVWYDLPTAEAVADQIAASLGALDPAHADDFTANAAAFSTQVDALVAKEAQLKSQYAGEGVGITEPVPLYMTEAVGLVDQTPEAFSEAIEEGDDVSAAVLEETLDLYADHAVAALVYNEQTSGPITEQVEAAATGADVPVVAVTETLPSGLDYVGWMTKNLDAIATALGQESR